MSARSLLLIAFLSSCAFAQHNNRAARSLQFSFGNPGARSLAFGGAFLALADDASAVMANPAGMTQTTRRNISFELQAWRNDNPIPFQSGEVVQTNLFEFDYRLQEANHPSRGLDLPFLALVFPKGEWRFGLFAHRQANLEREYSTERVDFDLLTASSLNISYDPSSDVLEVNLLQTGLSLARNLGTRAAFGLSLFQGSMEYRANSTIFLRDALQQVHPVYQTAEGKDDDWGGVLGLLWKASPHFSMGATYKKQGEFSYQASQHASLPNPDSPDFSVAGRFKVPDSFAIGCSLKASDLFTVNLDAVRVYYSQITDELIDFQRVPGVWQTMPDVTELHAGLEYAWLAFAHPLLFRLGYWLDPYHAAMNNIEDSQILDGSSRDPRVRDFFFLHRFSEDTHHYSLGLGFSFSQTFQVDAAYSWSESGEKASLSGIYRF